MLSAAFKTEKNPRGTCSSCWKNNNSRYLKQCCSFSALEQALNIAEFCEPWPPDTSFFHGLQLSLALPPKPHSQNVHQVVHYISLPADSSAKPKFQLWGLPSLTSKGHSFHIPTAALFLVLWGQKYTEITALPPSETPLAPCKPSAHSTSCALAAAGLRSLQGSAWPRPPVLQTQPASLSISLGERL